MNDTRHMTECSIVTMTVLCVFWSRNRVPKMVGILTYLSGHFSGGRPIRRDSHNTYEFLTHETVCRKRYEYLRLWLEPNQNTVVFWDCQKLRQSDEYLTQFGRKAHWEQHTVRPIIAILAAKNVRVSLSSMRNNSDVDHVPLSAAEPLTTKRAVLIILCGETFRIADY